jgi:hypothetical protein
VPHNRRSSGGRGYLSARLAHNDMRRCFAPGRVKSVGGHSTIGMLPRLSQSLSVRSGSRSGMVVVASRARACSLGLPGAAW